MERLPKGLLQTGFILMCINGAMWLRSVREGNEQNFTQLAFRVGVFVVALAMMAVGGVMKLLAHAQRPPREDEEERRDEFLR